MNLDLWRIIIVSILYSSVVCHYLFSYSVNGLQDSLDCLFYTIYAADVLLSFIDILIHFFIHSYPHYIAVMFLVPYVLKHKTSMSISIFECFLQYAKYLFHLLLVLSWSIPVTLLKLMLSFFQSDIISLISISTVNISTSFLLTSLDSNDLIIIPFCQIWMPVFYHYYSEFPAWLVGSSVSSKSC